MYLMITSRCNMECAHCCFSCRPGVGEDMRLKTFRAALRYFNDEYVALGGGEPTLHPLFEQILLETMAYSTVDECFGVCVVTNGTHTRRALMLASLTKKGLIAAELSIDEYHTGVETGVEIDDDVYEKFDNLNRIRTVNPVPTGRYRELLTPAEIEDWDQNNICACPDTIVRPNGDIYQCACADAPLLGNVNDPTRYIDYAQSCCYHSDEYKREYEYA